MASSSARPIPDRTKVILCRELETRAAERDPLREDFRRYGDRWLVEYVRQARALREELAERGIDVDTFDTTPGAVA